MAQQPAVSCSSTYSATYLRTYISSLRGNNRSLDLSYIVIDQWKTGRPLRVLPQNQRGRFRAASVLAVVPAATSDCASALHNMYTQ